MTTTEDDHVTAARGVIETIRTNYLRVLGGLEAEPGDDASPDERTVVADVREKARALGAARTDLKNLKERRQMALDDRNQYSRAFEQIDELRGMDREIERITADLPRLEGEFKRAGDLAHGYRLAGIGRRQQRILAEARAHVAKREALATAIREHQHQIDLLAQQLNDYHSMGRALKLEMEARALEPNGRRRVTVAISVVDPVRPRFPLVRPTAWAAFITGARARGGETVDAEINEVTGEIRAVVR